MENNTIFDDVFRTMLEKMPMFIMKRSITAKEMEPEAGS